MPTRTMDQVPAAVRGTRPRWLCADEPACAWGPFVVEWLRYRDLRELGFWLTPSPDVGPAVARYSAEASERTHQFEILAPPVIKGDAMILRTNSGKLLFRPVRESDASWIHPPYGPGDPVAS